MIGKLTIKSKLLSGLLATFHLLCLVTLIAGSGYECEPAGCGCKCTDGNGTYTMSLEGIGTASKPLPVPPPGTSWTYSVSTCHPFTKNTCTEVTMCQTSSDKKQSFPVAKINIESCSKADEQAPVKVTYAAVSSKDVRRKMIINVGCSKKPTKPSKVTESPKNTYTFGISTPDGCLQKVTNSGGPGSGGRLSTGSVIVIGFFVILVIYLVAGILFMKYKRGATGKEVIPNIEFWSSLPGLIKDGCVFFGGKMKELCGRCCNREGYNEI